MRWTQWIYWVIMLLMILSSAKHQLNDRRRHLEMYQYKGFLNANMDSYQTMRSKMKQPGSNFREGAYARDGPSDLDAGSDGDYMQDDGEEDRRPLVKNVNKR